MFESRSETSTVPVIWANFGIISLGAIQMISCHDWWPWTKPGFITMTRRQNNNQWSGGIAAPPPPKIPSAKIRCKSSRFDFLGSRRHPPYWLSSKGPNYFCWCNWRTYWRKNTAGRSPRGSCYCTTMPRLSGHLQPRRNWPTWASIFLITHPILRIWPRRTTTCSLGWKKKHLKVRHFSSDADFVAAAENWLEGQRLIFFWVACKS